MSSARRRPAQASSAGPRPWAVTPAAQASPRPAGRGAAPGRARRPGAAGEPVQRQRPRGGLRPRRADLPDLAERRRLVRVGVGVGEPVVRLGRAELVGRVRRIRRRRCRYQRRGRDRRRPVRAGARRRPPRRHGTGRARRPAGDRDRYPGAVRPGRRGLLARHVGDRAGVGPADRRGRGVPVPGAGGRPRRPRGHGRRARCRLSGGDRRRRRRGRPAARRPGRPPGGGHVGCAALRLRKDPVLPTLRMLRAGPGTRPSGLGDAWRGQEEHRAPSRIDR